MEPTVGRIVRFVQNSNHFAAVITWVWPNQQVNLFVFPSGSIAPVPGAVDHQNVAHTVPYDAAGGEWTWHWPGRE